MVETVKYVGIIWILIHLVIFIFKILQTNALFSVLSEMDKNILKKTYDTGLKAMSTIEGKLWYNNQWMYNPR